MAARPPQDDAPTDTSGDNSSTRGVGILGGPIFYAIFGLVALIIIAMIVLAAGRG